MSRMLNTCWVATNAYKSVVFANMRSDHQSRRLERTHRKLTDVSRLPQAISRRLPKPPRATNTHQRASNEDYLGFMFRPIDLGSSLTCEPTPPLSETVRHYISTNLYCRGERSEEGHYAGTAGGRFLFRLEWWVVAGPAERVERSLYQRGLGYNYEATKIFMPAGSEQPVVVHYQEHVPADVGAAFIWLKNRDPEHWRDVQNVEHVMGKYLISDKPMTLEEWASARATVINEVIDDTAPAELPAPKKDT
jgi:hypothetical protein